MASERKPYYVLGLTLGIASCGICLLDLENHAIVEMNSHLFDTPQENKTKVSLAVSRRNARSARRNNERTKNRQKHCMRLLQENGLVPVDADKQWLQTRKGDKPPLDLRVAGLDRALDDREWAQVLYSLSGRRGYIPRGTEGEVDDERNGDVLKAIAQNHEEMAAADYRTVGEMLRAKTRSRNRGGDYSLCVAHSQLVDEAKILFERQRAAGNANADEIFEQAYINCINWEKKTLEHDEKVYGLVGSCSYFPDEKRAAQADLSYEYLRAVERLAQLVIVDSKGAEARLSPEQRSRYLCTLFSTAELPRNKECKVRYSDIRKDLDLSATCSFKGIDADDEESKEPFAPKVWRSMRENGLPASLMEKMLDDREFADAIGEALCYASSKDSLRNRLEAVDLSDDEIDALIELPFNGKIFKGYGSRSLKAIRLLIDVFESPEIRTLPEAEEASGLLALRLADTGLRGYSLPPYDAFDPACKNPVVLRSMGRMRHIVNSIIKLHGIPDEIHIELGRELKITKKVCEKIAKQNKNNHDANVRILKHVGEFLDIEPGAVPGKLLRKYRFWEEQEGFDIYTGATIDHDRMLREEEYCEIDHILPYSRTCDNSRHNKVLVLTQSNQNKRERTPYEWMTQDSGKSGVPSWDKFKARTLTAHFSQQKRSKLLNMEFGEKEESSLIERNINDTRSMSRSASAYLAKSLAFPDDGKRHVFAVAGGASTDLRYAWGLGFSQKGAKDRADARHHAVDAAVIAACNSKRVIALARAHERKHNMNKEEYKQLLERSMPWPEFADDVIAAREQVLPTRMVDHGVTGRVFEDTLYRFEGIADEKKEMALLAKNVKHSETKTTTRKGNYVIEEDGVTAKLVDGMAFLRLWLDPGVWSNGQNHGQYYAEPVYYADLPAMRNGTYIPKACTFALARTAWPPVPESALRSEPIVLRRGDVLMIDDQIGRYWSINISVRSWRILDLVTGERCDFPSIGKLGIDNRIRIISEDTLGHCYDFLRPLPGEPRIADDSEE